MANNYKYFISGLDAQRDIVKLRKLFKSCYFLDGKHKDAKGVFVLVDRKLKEYGEKKPSVLTKKLISQGELPEGTEMFFWEPACSKDEFDIDSYHVSREPIPSIKVTLSNGKQIKINPACGEPKQLIFGEEYEEEKLPMASLYSQATEYGALAYRLIYKEEELKDTGGLMTNDPEVMKLIELALINSYSITQDVWNWLSWVSVNDIGSLYQAAMGADESFLESVAQL